MKIDGVVRRVLTGGKSAAVSPLSLDFQGSLAVSQVQALKSLRAVGGVRFGVTTAGGTGLAPITAWPTTTLAMALWNGSFDRYYFIDQVSEFCTGVATSVPAAGGVLLGCVSVVPQVRPAQTGSGANAGYAGTILSNLGGLGATGNTTAVFTNAYALTGPQPAWVVLASEPLAGTATAIIAAHAVQAEVGGGIMVPPGFVFGLSYMSGAGTNSPLYGLSVVWDEYAVDAS